MADEAENDTPVQTAVRRRSFWRRRVVYPLLLAETVGPHCGVCLDAFHMNIEEKDMHAAIRKVGSRLADFHVADNNRMACGMGVCLSCVRLFDQDGDKHFLRVCREGPVFPIRDVVGEVEFG